MGSRIIRALLVVLLSIPESRSQAITIPYDPAGSCEPLNSTLCASFGIDAGSLIYVNSTHTQAVLTSIVQDTLSQIALLRAIGFNACANVLTEYACLGSFTPCYFLDTQSPAGIVALPALPCYNSCVSNVVALCTPVFATFGRSVPPCPPETIVYDLSAIGGTSTTSNCTAFGAVSPPENVNEFCPLSYIFFGKKRPTQLRTAMIVFSYICMVELALVIVLTSLNARLRKWPGALILIMCGGQLVLSFGISMLSWVSLADLHCNSDRFYRNLCKAQAFMIVAGIHTSVMTWLVLTAVTTFCIWSTNPATAMRLTYKWRYYLGLAYLYPLAFTMYCCTDLGNVSVSIVCATKTGSAEEKGLVYPLLALVSLGTLLWIASMIGVAKAFRLGNGKSDVIIYVRLLLYELVAIIPTSLFCIPFEVYRDELTQFDSGQTLADPEFLKDTAWIVVASVSVAAILCPFLFGSIFLLRSDNWKFVLAGLSPYSSTTRSRRQQLSRTPPEL